MKIIKGEEPFDAYQNFGYRQVDHLRNKHKQPTPYDVSLLSACSFSMNVWRFSSSKNKSKSSNPYFNKYALDPKVALRSKEQER